MSSIYKNGIVSTDEITESSNTMLNTFTSGGYTPKNIVNSTIGANITGFVKGKKYLAEMLLVWNGFKTDVADNFNAWYQGANYINGAWAWSGANCLTSALTTAGNLKDIVLSAESGTKFISVEFTETSDATGHQLGMRFDNANGTGSVAYSNLKITPVESSIKSNNDGGKIYDSNIIANDFIEI